MENEIKLIQYVIVPKKPKMSKGKIASQVAHATLMALENQCDKKLQAGIIAAMGLIALQDKWINNGMCVIVLQCKDEVQLMGIAKYLEQWKIPNHLYIDEGIYPKNIPMGTPTSLSTGVLSEDKHWIFKSMRLFK